MLLSLALFFALQDPTPPPPAGDPPPPVADAPAPAPPPISYDDPLTGSPAAPSARPKPDKPLPPATGLDPFTTAGAQVGVGTVGCCVGCCVAIPFTIGIGLTPVVGTYISGFVGNIIIGTVIGGSEAVAGDWWGKQRAPMIWPIVASAGVLTAAAVASTVLSLVSAQVVQPPANFTDPNALNKYLAQAGGFGLASIAINVGAIAIAIVLPAGVYMWTAVDKKPGDTGQGFPGLLSPADPVPTPKPSAASSSSPVAMAY